MDKKQLKDLTTEEIVRIADAVNAYERGKLLDIYTGTTGELDAVARLRASGEANTQKTAAHWRQIASIPGPAHFRLMKVYGKDYWKSRDFWKKSEEGRLWAVVKPQDL